MGIHNLLPILKPAITQVSLSDFRGKRVAVDGNVWIHRGSYACAADLVAGNPTSAYVNYVKNMVQLLLQHGVRPYVVFDGRPLPAKHSTAVKRRELRARAQREMAENSEALKELEAQQARQPYDATLQYEIGAARQRVDRSAQSSVSVSREMVEAVMAALRTMPGVETMRAPYAADALTLALAPTRTRTLTLTLALSDTRRTRSWRSSRARGRSTRCSPRTLTSSRTPAPASCSSSTGTPASARSSGSPTCRACELPAASLSPASRRRCSSSSASSPAATTSSR